MEIDIPIISNIVFGTFPKFITHYKLKFQNTISYNVFRTMSMLTLKNHTGHYKAPTKLPIYQIIVHIPINIFHVQS